LGRRRRLWIHKAVKKRGALSRQLNIPIEKDIPKTLLRKIKATETGETIRNPTKTGKRRIKVTKLLKKRATLALTLKELPRRRAR